MIGKNAEQLLRAAVGDANIRLDEPMKRHTSFRVGGPADILITPENDRQLADAVKICRDESIPVFIMGNGTNLVVRDKGIRGAVVKLFEKFSAVKVEGGVITAEAGLLLSRLAKVALEHGLSGLEFASGIPGTLGGAVFMNAGAYGGEMKDVVTQTEYLGKDGTVKALKGEEHLFGYRSSAIQGLGGIVLRTEMRLKQGDRDAIKAKMADLDQRRKEKQPLEMPSAGSIFKRPEGHYTGRLIEECGLKGYRLGGAEVSRKHCGFIVNAGGASAGDILGLIEHIKHTVRDKFGVELVPEVRIVGEE